MTGRHQSLMRCMLTSHEISFATSDRCHLSVLWHCQPNTFCCCQAVGNCREPLCFNKTMLSGCEMMTCPKSWATWWHMVLPQKRGGLGFYTCTVCVLPESMQGNLRFAHNCLIDWWLDFFFKQSVHARNLWPSFTLTCAPKKHLHIINDLDMWGDCMLCCLCVLVHSCGSHIFFT